MFKNQSTDTIVKKEELEVKEEPPSDNEEDSEIELVNSASENQDSESEKDDEVQLMDGVKVGQKKKKEKKAKSEDLKKKLELEEVSLSCF